MRIRIGVILIVHGVVLSIFNARTVVADDNDQVRKDRRQMATGVGVMAASTGVMAAGVMTLNPIAAVAGAYGIGAGAGVLGNGAIKQRIHRKQAERDQMAGSPAQALGPVEYLVPVSGRPGYFFYPSNPNQLYYSQPPAADPMQAQIAQPEAPVIERIAVRIANPSKVGPPIDCSVDGTPFSISPGMVLSVTAARRAVISYARGDRPEPDRFTLDNGDYEFRTVDSGRGLYRLNQPLAVATRPSDAKAPAQGSSVPR